MSDLVAFSVALRTLLAAMRAEFTANPHTGNAAAYALCVLVPLARSLEKLLHQRGAVRTYRAVLGTLAFRLLWQPLRPGRLMQRPEVLLLPMTGRLMSALVTELTAVQRDGLRYCVSRNAQLMHALGELQGSTYVELCRSFEAARVDTYKVDKGERLTRILRTIQPSLSASDFAYLRSNVIGRFNDAVLDTPLLG